jgi:hypothetical protein
MNSELLLIRLGDEAEGALAKLIAFSVSGAAVVDTNGVARGVVSWRDLVGRVGPVERFMSTPPTTVVPETTIETAAHEMAERNHHRLVVVDPGGVPVGMVSIVDVMRGLLGRPTHHPRAFPHYDRSTRLTWSDNFELSPEHLENCPDTGGLVVLVHAVAGEPDRIVWAEATDQIRSFLSSVLEDPEAKLGGQSEGLAEKRVHARYARVPDLEKRQSALSQVLLSERDRRRSGQ